MGARPPDRLSLLPDEILLRIFSFIPDTEEIARTSVLSKRFRCLWAYRPSLRLGYELPGFDSGDQASLNAYFRSVDACFASFRSPTLDSLALLLPACKPSARSDRWIRFAAARSVRRLRLTSLPLRGGAAVPSSIFACEKLSSLSLIGCSLPKKIPLNFQGFRFLTDLSFYRTSISDNPLASLLSGCPSLESLSLYTCHNLINLEVSSRTLKHLLVTYCQGLCRASFNAPNLQSVQFSGDVEVLSLKHSDMLADVLICHFCYPATISQENWERSMLELSHTSQTLQVNQWVFQFVLGRNMTPVFKNLKKLRCAIDWVTAHMLRGLASLLHHCLNLEKLYLDLSIGSRSNFVVRKQKFDKQRPLDESLCASVREAVPPLEDEELCQAYRECLDKEYKVDKEGEIWDPSEGASADYLDSAVGLKSVVIRAFLGTTNEMKLLEFLLSRANVLETLTIGDYRMRSKEEIQKLLAYIPRASPLVQICEMEVDG